MGSVILVNLIPYFYRMIYQSIHCVFENSEAKLTHVLIQESFSKKQNLSQSLYFLAPFMILYIS